MEKNITVPRFRKIATAVKWGICILFLCVAVLLYVVTENAIIEGADPGDERNGITFLGYVFSCVLIVVFASPVLIGDFVYEILVTKRYGFLHREFFSSVAVFFSVYFVPAISLYITLFSILMGKEIQI